MSQYQKGKTNLDFTEARDSKWQWHQLGHMQVCTLLQTENYASTPPLSFLQAICPSCRPTNSVKALKAYEISKKRKTADQTEVAVNPAIVLAASVARSVKQSSDWCSFPSVCIIWETASEKLVHAASHNQPTGRPVYVFGPWASTPLEHWGGRRSSAEDARIEAP